MFCCTFVTPAHQGEVKVGFRTGYNLCIDIFIKRYICTVEIEAFYLGMSQCTFIAYLQSTEEK